MRWRGRERGICPGKGAWGGSGEGRRLVGGGEARRAARGGEAGGGGDAQAMAESGTGGEAGHAAWLVVEKPAELRGAGEPARGGGGAGVSKCIARPTPRLATAACARRPPSLPAVAPYCEQATCNKACLPISTRTGSCPSAVSLKAFVQTHIHLYAYGIMARVMMM